MEQVVTPTKAYENCFVKRDEDTGELRSSPSPLKVKKSAINYVELVHQNYYQNQPRKEDKDHV